MPKAKITVTVTKEIDLDKVRHYFPEGYTPEQMLAEEIRYADNLFHEWLETGDPIFETKGELIG